MNSPSMPSSSGAHLEVLITASPARSVTLAVGVLRPMLELPPDRQIPLLDNLRAWFTSESLNQAAVRAGCSVGTVKKRLRRVEELTGRSHQRPDQLAELWIALETLRLFGYDQNDPGGLISLMGKFVDYLPQPDARQ